MEESRIRLLVVDDHPVLVEGVTAMLENYDDIQLVGHASDGIEALDLFRRLRPDVILMDLQMPGMNGFEAISAIRAEDSSARILVLTTYGNEGQARRALRAGAQGYLLKSSLRTDMADAIRRVNAGETYLQTEVAAGLAAAASSSILSEREVRVLSEVAQGRSNREIAAELSISDETVKAHLKHIFSKLDVTDRTHAVTKALQRGVLQID